MIALGSKVENYEADLGESSLKAICHHIADLAGNLLKVSKFVQRRHSKIVLTEHFRVQVDLRLRLQ